MSRTYNVLVIGGSGFLGSHVADKLSDNGHNVTIFDKKESPYLREDQSMIVGSVLDRDLLESCVSEVDIVYNFVGIAGISHARCYPVDTIEVNVNSNLYILEACRKYNIKKYVYASSMYVYNEYASFYGTSKKMSELLIENYHREFGLNYAILRYGSLFGPRCQSWNGIYKVVREAVETGKINFRGWPEEIREFIHVKDAADLSVEVLNRDNEQETLVLTGIDSYKWKDFLDMINETLGGYVDITYTKPNESLHYRRTPYIYKPNEAIKVTKTNYRDVRESIYNLAYELEEDSNEI